MSIGKRFYVDSAASVAQLQGTNLPGVLYEASGANVSGGPLWFMVINAVGPVADGATPTYSFPVPNGGTIAIAPPGQPGESGRPYGTGICVAWSSTQAALTAVVGGPLYVAGRELT
jgi:hypothetical protein